MLQPMKYFFRNKITVKTASLEIAKPTGHDRQITKPQVSQSLLYSLWGF